MTQIQPTPEARAFRDGMSRLGAAVNVITTDGSAGRHGLTVSAVCSVTDSPPTLLVCINRSAYAHDAFIENGVLAVNVLGDGHRELSADFARWTGEDRFARADWRIGATGAPCLADSVACFDSRIVEVQEHGSHSVLFCRVCDTAISDANPGGLFWFSRNFHILAEAGE